MLAPRDRQESKIEMFQYEAKNGLRACNNEKKNKYSRYTVARASIHSSVEAVRRKRTFEQQQQQIENGVVDMHICLRLANRIVVIGHRHHRMVDANVNANAKNR